MVYTKFLSMSGNLVLGDDLRRFYWAYAEAFTNLMFKGGNKHFPTTSFPLDNLTSIGPVFRYYTHATKNMSHNQRSTPAWPKQDTHWPNTVLTGSILQLQAKGAFSLL